MNTSDRHRMLPSLALLGAALALAGCEEIPSPQIVPCAELEEFKPVSNVLERRCGTLDCHGEYARPLRIYGQNGLRAATVDELDPDVAQQNGTVSGGDETSEAEVRLNWRSVCGLEPEKTAQVIFGQAAPEELMILRKPLRLERHKGEQLFQQGDNAAVCVSCWLRGFPDDVVECEGAIEGCADAVASGTL
jgi:hypothetical protein